MSTALEHDLILSSRTVTEINTFQIQTKTNSAALPLSVCICQAAHLHVQLQDVGVGPQQLTQVGFGATEVSVDELFDVTVSRRSGARGDKTSDQQVPQRHIQIF